MKKNLLLIAGLAGLLSACSTVIEGTSQDIAVNTDPEGANCGLHRNGVVIGRINPTPGAVAIDKTKHDIVIRCTLDGFHETGYFNKSDVAGATAGNIALGVLSGGVGWIIDSSTGADNKYDGNIYIPMVPVSEPAPAIPSTTDENPAQPDDDDEEEDEQEARRGS